MTDTPPDIQTHDITTASGKLLRPARVERADWVDPADTSPVRRKPRVVSGFRVVSPLVNAHRQTPRDITAEHIQAAERLLSDYEMAEGAQSGGDLVFVDGAGGCGPTIGQIDAIGRIRAARQALGPLAQFVLPVVLAGWTFSRLAEASGMHIQRVSGRIGAGLDILHAHYWPDSRHPTYVRHDNNTQDK